MAYPTILGLSGKRASGKDTAAGLIRQMTAFDQGKPGLWNELRFAAILKRFVADWLDMPVEALERQDVKAQHIDSLGMTIGELLQKAGVGMRDLIHPDFWIIGAMNRVEAGKHYICPDVRFPNEVAAIESAGGYVLRIEGDPQKLRERGGRDDSHSSETALDHLDLPTIRNNSSLHTLRARLSNVLAALRSGARPKGKEAKKLMGFK